MKFTELDVPGAYLIQPELIRDDRGFFARIWCRDEMRDAGLDMEVSQMSFSYNHKRGTLRGLHFQRRPFEETKLVRCSRGALFDVILDLRDGSPTFRRWISLELTEENHHIVYVPKGCAHGFQTLVDGTEINYQMSEAYRASEQTGVRWNDSSLEIPWPVTPPIVSRRDMSLPLLEL